MSTKQAHAIVIGGSIAGLLTARVLSDHFERVTIIERDTLPQEKADRSGTPQSKHPHNLLARGSKIIESLLPGFEADLFEAGALKCNWGKNVRTRTLGGWLKSLDIDLYSPVASRALVEWVIRSRVKALPGVQIIDHTQVQGLLTEGDAVVGLRVKPRGGGSEYRMDADFVVDASGRGSKASEWLAELGFGQVEETTVDPKVGYATRLYKKPVDTDWSVYYIPAKYPETRGAGIFTTEGDVWMVALGGYAGDFPPTDHDDFLEYARSFSDPEFYNLIKDAEPISDIIGYRRTLNVFRHYERMQRFPEGFALLGDAVCGFNPIYGQGITSAAMAAELLGNMLKTARPGLRGFGKQFQKRLAAQCQNIWLISTGEDFRFPSTEGVRPGRFARIVQMYVDEVLKLAPQDSELHKAFLYVMNLDKPATSLFAPRILWRVLRGRRAQNPAQSGTVHMPEASFSR
jgi:flavin-dependent dehydrogenase